VAHADAILENPERMLGVIASESVAGIRKSSPADMTSLWQSGLVAGPLFAVDARPEASADREAQSIVARHLERQQSNPKPAGMSQLLEFQHTLQMRSKVISAIETLMRG
jgi:hypothetical protein